MVVRGSCLCGEVRFEIDGRVSPIGLCHCSKCRKATGTGAVCDLMTSARSLRFTQGEARVRHFMQPSGYRTAFCEQCGSPMPKPQRNGKLWWVPAGSLDDDPLVGIAAHIYVDSKAPWDVIPEGVEQFPEGFPDG